jgi:uncharacterized protein YycO
MKKIISLILALVIVFSMSITVSAASKSEYETYTDLVQRNILGEDITFEDWQELKWTASELEASFENTDDLTKVYSGLKSQVPDVETYSMEPGDVLVTSGVMYLGVNGALGHCGIAISSEEIVHIQPDGIKTVSLDDWLKTYNEIGWTKIYRHSDPHVAQAAAKWTETTYKDNADSVEYVITTDLASTNQSYCSKLVWQAYYFGPDTPCANGELLGVKLPYALHTTIQNLTLVKIYEKTE